MKREILINGSQRETRVAILEDDRLVELLVDRPDHRRTVGDIYLGQVEAVLPGIQAAFVDIGLEKSAFLHASDLLEPEEDEEPTGEEGDDAFEEAAEAEEEEGKGRGRGRRGGDAAPWPSPASARCVPVGRCRTFRHRQEGPDPAGAGHQGADLHQGLPGDRADLSAGALPGVHALRLQGRRQPEDREQGASRQASRDGVDLLPKDSGGVIVRTVAEGVTEEHFRREVEGLLNLWKKINRKKTFVRAPALVQRETSLTRGIIRDLFSAKVDSLQVDSKELFNEIEHYLKQVDPELLGRVNQYSESVPLFDKFDIENEIRDLFKARCDLPTGGYIIIQPTEALVSIDVNTGRYTGKKDPEKTILRTNLEAAREIARQIRLRDIGGIIVCDFIDMETRQNRDRVLQELRAHLGRDRARTKAFAVSELGLIEMTRQRVRPSLWHSMTTECPTCWRDRPGVHSRGRRPTPGADSQAGRPGAARAAARRPAPSRGGALPPRGGAQADSYPRKDDRPRHRAPGRPDDAAGRVPPDEPAGRPGRDRAVRGCLDLHRALPKLQPAATLTGS